MTREQRAQVVELLRCAADRLLNPGDADAGSMIAPFTDTVVAIHGDRDGDRRGLATCRELIEEIRPLWWTDASNVETAMAALEGAMRVEEGTWP